MIAYYVIKLGRGEFAEAVNLEDPSQGTQVAWASFMSKTVVWGIAAIVLGLTLGLAGNLARNQGFRGLPFQVVIPFVAIVETTMRLRVEASRQGDIASATWGVTLFAAVAAVVFLVGRVMVAHSRRRAARQERSGSSSRLRKAGENPSG
ncbi:hypothetical protein [Streptomyces mirabilis]|uniref:hypothetical protein n=1 Tax=Streptomyces mirabilis TaxID=68239 RepID=UPI0033B59AE3